MSYVLQVKSISQCVLYFIQYNKVLTFVVQKYNDLFTHQLETLQFELNITQFVAVGEGLARCIGCLEATATNPADVYLYWLAMLACMKQTLETCALPDGVCSEIRGIINSRWQEFFITGPTNVHLSAFYLNPSTFLLV